MEREIKQKRKAILEQEINDLQLAWEVADDLNRRKLAKEMEMKFAALKEIEDSLSEHIAKEEKAKISKIDLAKMDFADARSSISQHCNSLDATGGFLALVVENCRKYKGDLLIEEIRDRFGTGRKLKRIVVDPEAGWSDEAGLMQAIHDCLGSTHDMERLASLSSKALIEKIATCCCPGMTFFFELNNWGDLEDGQVPLLNWFFFDFWNALLVEFPAFERRHGKVRFVAIVSDKGRIGGECFTLTEAARNCLKIELTKWHEPEIRSWLTEYANFPSIEEVTNTARKISRRSEGIPLEVFLDLQDYFCFV